MNAQLSLPSVATASRCGTVAPNFGEVGLVCCAMWLVGPAVP